jgi:integrase
VRTTGGTLKRCPCPPQPCPDHGSEPCPRSCKQRPPCPDRDKRGHVSWGWQARLDTTKGRKLVRRFGFAYCREAEDALRQVRDLVALVGDDDRVRRQIGDMIDARTLRGGTLPDRATVARRLGLGADPGAPGATFGEAWPAWLAGRRTLRPSSRRRLEQIGEHWLLPVLANVALERLNGALRAEVFTRVERINAEITAQRAAGKAQIRAEGDVRTVPKVIGIASQHRIYAALQAFCNFEVRKTRRLAFNPIYAVELEPEVTPEADHWTATEEAAFLAASVGDPLHLLFRVVLLRGARRAEACGFRWSGADLDAGYVTVDRPILQLGGAIVEGRAKSKAGERQIWLDAATVAMLREHRKAQFAARLKAGAVWQDNDLVFCREDGSPWPPDYISRRFKVIASAAGLRPIKLHEGRHSAASLARTAEVDAEIRRKTLGHADQAMTSHYTHIEAEAHRQAAEAVAALVDGAAS